MKQGLCKQKGDDIHHRLARFLLNYRRTPQSTTNTSPAELLFRRTIRTRLDLLRPSLDSSVLKKQEKWASVNRREREPLELGTPVLARNYGVGARWLPGVVTETRSPHFILVTSSSKAGVLHRHPDQLRRSRGTLEVEDNDTDNDDDWPLPAATVASPSQ